MQRTSAHRYTAQSLRGTQSGHLALTTDFLLEGGFRSTSHITQEKDGVNNFIATKGSTIHQNLELSPEACYNANHPINLEERAIHQTDAQLAGPTERPPEGERTSKA